MRRAERWLFAPEDARRLVGVRIGLCGVLALRLAMNDFDADAARHARFAPHFYMDLFNRMPSPELANALQICGIVAALAAAAGIAFRVTLPTAFVCSLLLHGILNSGGRVIVGDAVLMLCLLVLLVAGGGVRGQGVGERYGWPIRTMMVAVALAYFFAGFQKWRYSGFAWVTSDNLRWILYGQMHPNGLALFIAGRPLLDHLFAAGALMLETCFPLVLFFPRLRWVFIPAAIAMHVGIQFVIRLDYSAQWLTAVIVFVNWPVAVEWVRGALSPEPAAREVPG
jgi:hypothetical protein